MRVDPSGLQTFTTFAGQSGRPPLIVQPHPMAVLLFGKRPPRRVDARRYPSLKKALRKLLGIRDDVAALIGLDGDDFPLSLAEGSNASISQHCEVFIGLQLLAKHERDTDLLVGIIGHEIGHNPRDWPRLPPAGISQKKRLEIVRLEEDKADRFSGRAMADLGASPEPLCIFLENHAGFESKANAEYFPPDVRARSIRDAYRRRMRRLSGGDTGLLRKHRVRDLR
ncbi:MAG: hypothetical protein ACKVPX_04910 [Myxococcaceae bacterium]